MAVIAIALHTVLWAAVTPLTAASAIDLVPVIGLSETSPNRYRSTTHARRHTRATTVICAAPPYHRWLEGVRLALDPPTPGS